MAAQSKIFDEFFFFLLESCEKHPVFKHLVEECNAGYSWSVEQQENFSPGWNEELNKTMRYRARRGKRKALYLGLEDPWRYKSMVLFIYFFSAIFQVELLQII